MVILGFVLARVLQAQLLGRTLAEETRAARLIAHIGIQPRLTPEEVRNGLSAAEIHDLDGQLRTAAVKRELARIKIWNAADTVVYSDDHGLIGRTLQPSDDLEEALDGRATGGGDREPLAALRDGRRGRAGDVDRGLRAAALLWRGTPGGGVRDVPQLQAGGGRDRP